MQIDLEVDTRYIPEGTPISRRGEEYGKLAEESCIFVVPQVRRGGEEGRRGGGEEGRGGEERRGEERRGEEWSGVEWSGEGWGRVG